MERYRTNKMKIAVTGHKGRIGSSLINRGYEPLDCDITKMAGLCDAIYSANPDIIIHCAALTDVDECQANPTKAHEINCRGLGNVLDCIGKMEKHPKLIFISSSHVFKGSKYWTYSEKHDTAPVNIYGLTKQIGENLVLNLSYPPGYVVRTSKLFDAEFLAEGLNHLRDGEEFEMSTLLKRSFLYIEHFVNGLVRFVENIDKMPHLLHIASMDTMSYYDFWLQIANVFGYNHHLVKPRRSELKDATPRPFQGGLKVDLSRSLGIPLYYTHEGLK